MAYEEISTSHPKARKEYGCEWCAKVILKGEKHFQRTYRWEGDFCNGRMHLECELAMDKSKDIYDGWMPGDFKRGETTEGMIVTLDPQPAPVVGSSP